MAWGLWNKIKKGFRKVGKWINNKIIKPIGRVIKPVWNKVVKPVTETISKIPGIEKMPSKVGIVGKVGKGITAVSLVIDNLLK